MTQEPQPTTWDFSPAINLGKTLSVSNRAPAPWTSLDSDDVPSSDAQEEDSALGNFSKIFRHILEERERVKSHVNYKQDTNSTEHYTYQNSINGQSTQTVCLHGNNVHVRSGDVIANDTRSNIPSSKKSASRKNHRKKEKQAGAAVPELTEDDSNASDVQDSTTDVDSDDDLTRLRRSPDRTAVIRSILGPLPGRTQGNSPPTSPSPPKSAAIAILKRERPVSDPFYSYTGKKATLKGPQIVPIDGLNAKQRRLQLISLLCRDFPVQSRTLLNERLLDAAFLPQNTDAAGIHVFIDISNIMIGFHDCLKLARGLPIAERVRRVPMSFHNFSIVLERGRPAARRILAGSDRYQAIDEAKLLGYELNILERVHKAKEPTPRKKRFQNDLATTGASSGSETNQRIPAPEKWVEQAVDEIIHLKILESIIDAEKPATMVLATGDAAEAEYSAGFMKMVERALLRGWMVELVSFKFNTSGLYKRKEFRSRWGRHFKWVQLDDYVEQLLEQA